MRDKFKIMTDLNNTLGAVQDQLRKANELFMELRFSLDKPTPKPKTNEKAKAAKPKSTAKKRPSKSGDAIPKKANQTNKRQKKV